MAPINHAIIIHPLYNVETSITTMSSSSSYLAASTAAPAPSATAHPFVAVTVGRSSNAIDLLIPLAPSVQSGPELKAQVFDFLSDRLLES